MARPGLSLPDYWLAQPPMQLDAATRHACDALLADASQRGAGQPVDYRLPIPKWQFLCYVAEEHAVALHGSGHGEIMRFEPRRPQDLTEFGAQEAVYAAADGLWPLYFAIVNRAASPSLINACVYVEAEDGTLSRPYYFFSISRAAIQRTPYRDGVVYLLPRHSFRREPAMQVSGWRIHTAQLASSEAVVPLAKVAVTPEDFPFLAQMRTHEDARLAAYAAAMQQGLPLPD